MSKERMFRKGVHSFQFDEIEIEALIEILAFAGQTAAYLAHHEAKDGKAGKQLVRLARLANDSNDILKYIKDSLDIGEPDPDSVN